MTRSASAPGRVNLLGEHVDHQGGTVLPVAVDLRTTVRHEPGEAWTFLSEGHPAGGAWERYARAVLEVLGEAGESIRPGRLTVRSALPERSGLGSSAALEVALAGALSDLPAWDLARLCRRAENERVGVPCGLMDQAASACARKGCVLVLDCAAETHRHLPLPEAELLLLDSGVRRSLADTPYARRQAEAREPGTPAARHVEGERARVERGVRLLERGDAAAFGALLFESHASLRDLYRCSLPAIDTLVTRLASTDGVYGARLTGAGWGGNVLALARPGTRIEGARALGTDDGLLRWTLPCGDC